MMPTSLEAEAKPISPKRAAAELEVVLSKSLFLTTPEGSDFEGSFSLSESDISRDSAYEWANPERRRLAPRSASNPRPRRQSSPASGMVRPRPTLGRSKSVGSVTSCDSQQDMYQLSKPVKSLMDDDSCTAESSVENSGERFTLIANIGDMQKDTSLDMTARSVGSRKSKRSGRSRASRRSMLSRKRGDSLEREISLTILQTAAEGADSAHFLVSNTEVVKSPVKSAEEILGDLFVSQDVSLEPIYLEEGDTEFRSFFAEDEQQSPATSEDAVISAKPTEDSLFTFNPVGEGRSDEEDEQDEGPSYAKKYNNPRPEAKRGDAAIISEAPSKDSLFAFSDVTDDTTRGKELLFPEDALREEFPIGSRWAPEDTLKKTEQPTPAKSPRLMLRPRPEFNDLSVKRPSTPLALSATHDELRTSSTEQSNDRYKIEMESSAGATLVDVAPSRSFVSASDGASEVQQALAMVTSPSTSTVEEGALNLEREDSFVDEDGNVEKVKQEEIFLDKLVDIVHVARERPLDIHLSEFYKSESAETESTVTVEYPEDEIPTHADAENQQSASVVPRVKSLEKIGDDDHPDPELDDFLEEHGFGDSDDESQGEEDGEWMAFDNSPFGVSRFADDRVDDASGSTAPPPTAEGKTSPESPTSITDFSTTPSAQEKAEVIWWNKEHPDDADGKSI